MKIHLIITLDVSGIFVNIWCTPLFQHALSCKNAKSQIHLKLKVKLTFPYVLQNRKYHSNPHIQGTTIPCDTDDLQPEVR